MEAIAYSLMGSGTAGFSLMAAALSVGVVPAFAPLAGAMAAAAGVVYFWQKLVE